MIENKSKKGGPPADLFLLRGPRIDVKEIWGVIIGFDLFYRGANLLKI